MSLDKIREEAGEAFFAELKDTFFFQTQRIHKAFFRQCNYLLQEAGIDVPLEQFPVLLTTYSMKSVSQREIADITLRDKSSIQRSVTALQRKGLLTITQDGTDKRKHVITLTPEGIALAKKTKQILRKGEDSIFIHFTAEERAQAILSMRNIADKLDKR